MADMIPYIICFFAALVQTTTSLGFGLIIAPMLLALYSPIDAIQITGTLTLLIAAIMAISNRQHIVYTEAKQLALGSLVGLLIGGLCLVYLPITSIRLAALVVLVYACVRYIATNLKQHTVSDATPEDHNPMRAHYYGFASGMMNGTLAMPGPMALIFIRSKRLELPQLKATVFAVVACSYTAMLALSASFNGVNNTALYGLWLFLPPTLMGLFIGSVVAARIPSLWFDITTTLLMLATIILLGAKILSISLYSTH